MPEVTHAREHHRDAVLVGGGDDFLVAHAAAGLDHGTGPRVGQRLDAVAKREEGIRCDGRALQRGLECAAGL